MDYKDYYATLGVPRTATTGEIKKAYRKLARQFHPDRNPGDAAAERRFKEINEANEVLADPTKRTQYDELGAHWQDYARSGGRPGADPFGAGGSFDGFRTSGAGAPGGGVRFEFAGDPADFSEFFRTFFAGGVAGAAAGAAGARATAARGGARGAGTRGRAGTDDLGGATLEDILAGMGAAGMGSPAGSGHADGRAAGGRSAGGAGRHRAAPRPVEAAISVRLEEAARGATRLLEIDGKRIEVTIPPGVETGSRIRLRGKGGGHGDSARDLVLVVAVEPHPVYAREGSTLSRELPVTLGEALLGADVPVPTVDGRRLLLKIPAGTQPGRTIRLAGQGMPRLKDGVRGDLLVRIRVVLPTLDEQGKQAAATFLDSVHQDDPRAHT